MNGMLLNRDFKMPEDGWYQMAPLGEFAHAGAGVVQVVDREACEAMVNRFREESQGTNFAGLLVDFDHFSLVGEKRSEAAGWITGLENRDGGLFAKIRWSDVGEEAVKGGRYRFLSPVWTRMDCVDLGNGRVRPVRLLNAAVTNDPNMKGMRPLSNRSQETGARIENERAAGAAAETGPAKFGEEKRYKWVMGENGDHCPSCAAMAGQVHTMAEWEAGGVKPGAGSLYCQGKCQCRLEETAEASGGAVTRGPVRKEKREMENSGESGARAEGREGESSRRGAEAQRDDRLANTGWTDEARAASLAVRRAKAAARKAKREAGGNGKDGKRKTEGPSTGSGEAEAGKAGEETGGGTDEQEKEYLGWFEEEGIAAMSKEAVEGLKQQIRRKLAAEKEGLTESEEGFLEELADEEDYGESEEDPIARWQEARSMQDRAIERAVGMDARAARGKAAELEEREAQGERLSSDEKAFLRMYRGAFEGWGESVARGASFAKASEANDAENAEGRVGNGGQGEFSRRGAEALSDRVMANAWGDEARAAALAVRRAKASRRDPPGGVKRVEKRGDGRVYAGGSPYFDERTGKYVYPSADDEGFVIRGPVGRRPMGQGGPDRVPRGYGVPMYPRYPRR